MWKYIIRRVLLIIPATFLAATMVWFMLRVLPGDVVTSLTSEGGASQETKDKLREELGLNDPIIVQYFNWVKGAVQGELGYSYYQNRQVASVLRDKLEATLTMALLAMTISLALAIPMGIIGALKRASLIDQGTRAFTAITLAIPQFWLGILMLLASSRWFGWSPPIIYDSFLSNPAGNLSQMAMPAVAVALASAAIISRLVRSMMLEVLREDYVRTARAKGLVERVVILRHTIRNAFIPVLTMSAYHFSFILSGVVVIENVFNIPGLGRQILMSVFARDYDMVVGIILAFTVILFVWILITDLLYSWVDPRIRYT